MKDLTVSDRLSWTRSTGIRNQPGLIIWKTCKTQRQGLISLLESGSTGSQMRPLLQRNNTIGLIAGWWNLLICPLGFDCLRWDSRILGWTRERGERWMMAADSLGNWKKRECPWLSVRRGRCKWKTTPTNAATNIARFMQHWQVLRHNGASHSQQQKVFDRVTWSSRHSSTGFLTTKAASYFLPVYFNKHNVMTM